MADGTALVRRTLDLTRAPDEQWNDEMVKLVASQVLKRASTKGEQLYCLAVADALNLNPFIGEIYFIPSKSKDGSGPGILPYIGRNGLVKKATERGAYFESDTVHANDRFRMTRRKDGSVEVTHSYGSEDRGEIVGAYAFLHFRNGDRPAFFYARLEEYLPTFDQEWKMNASPWGNQRSAMIEKCAMIGAGRKRLDLGNVLGDGEVDALQQMGSAGPRAVAAPAGDFDFATVTRDAELASDLTVAASAAKWSAAKCEMLASGMSDDELRGLLERLRSEAGEAPAQEEIVEAEVVSEPDPERVAALQARVAELESRIGVVPPGSREFSELSDELDHVSAELDAVQDPQQGSLL